MLAKPMVHGMCMMFSAIYFFFSGLDFGDDGLSSGYERYLFSVHHMHSRQGACCMSECIGLGIQMDLSQVHL